jgi:hypothetical protein
MTIIEKISFFGDEVCELAHTAVCMPGCRLLVMPGGRMIQRTSREWCLPEQAGLNRFETRPSKCALALRDWP